MQKICNQCKRYLRHHGRGMCSGCHREWIRQQDGPVFSTRKLSEVERFWYYVEKTETCWLWTGGISQNGYGVFATGSRANGTLKFIAPHRYVLILSNVELPKGMFVDHLCRNKRCLNPDHLDVVTPRENTLRGIGPSSQNAVKDACHNGHPFNEENTYVSKKGARMCRQCLRDRRARAKLLAYRSKSLSILDTGCLGIEQAGRSSIVELLGAAPLNKIMEHDYYQHCESNDCGGTCPLCCLGVCKVCGLWEGSLTTHCPGEKATDHGDAVYACKEDYRDGRWVRLASPHSPNYKV